MEDEKTLLERLVSACRKAGLTAVRITHSTDLIRSVTATQSGTLPIEEKTTSSLVCDGFKDGKLARINAGELEDLDPDSLAQSLLEGLSRGRDYQGTWFPRAGIRLGKSESYSSKLDKISESLLPNSASLIVKSAMEASPEVVDASATVSHWVGHTTMVSYSPLTEGEVLATLTYRRDGLHLHSQIEVARGDLSASSVREQSIHKSLDNLDEVGFAKASVNLALSKLGAAPLEAPFEGEALLCPKAAAIVLSAACSHLDGSRIRSGRSVYADKLGTDVFSEALIVLNDPFTASDYARPFDMEGTPTEKFMAIDRGRLRCFFLDSESAGLSGGKTNGCAGYQGCECQYLVVTPSDTYSSAMISGFNDGLIVEDVYAGRAESVDPETLDLRIPFSGWLVKGGSKSPVSGTLTGRADETLKNIVSVSRDRGDYEKCLTPWFKVSGQKAE